MVDIPQADWRRHVTGDRHCGHCAGGFPYPCPCGGQVHGEVLSIPDNGYIQLTRCERCEVSDNA